MLQVADVLADECLAVHHQRDRVFQIGAQRQDRPLQGNVATAPGSIAARPAQNDRTESAHRGPRNRPPGARWAAARSEMHPRCRRDAAAHLHPRRRSVRSSGWRWSSPEPPARPPQTAGDATACRAASLPVRCCRERPRSSSTFAGASTIGRAVEVSSASLSDGKLHQPASHIEVPHHDRERLLLAIFALAQSRHGRGISGIASQVISAQPFYRDNLSRAQQLSRMANGWLRSGMGRLLRLQDNNRARTPDTLRAAHESGGCRDRDILRAQ